MRFAILFIALVTLLCGCAGQTSTSDPSRRWDERNALEPKIEEIPNYVGQKQDGKRHGQGTMTWASGSKYVGEWLDDKYHGKGTFDYANGDAYIGEWEDGERHGKGTMTRNGGNKYVGEWKDGEPHGQGSLAYTNTAIYIGDIQVNGSAA
jgi:hypothetical protein